MMNGRHLRAGVMGCLFLLGYVHPALGAGLFSAIKADTNAPVPQWPVLRNAAQEPVGLYGGLVSAYAGNGEIQSATLLILPTGYVMPVLHSGETATFPVTYYEQAGCKGTEYLAASGVAGALLPIRGMVYRSPTADALVYLPKDAVVRSTQVRSKWMLGSDQASGRCESATLTLSLFASRPNEVAVTGVDPVVGTGPLALTVEQADVRVRRAEKATEGSAGTVRGFTEDLPGEAAMEETLPECSPGCLVEAVGNGICDIACYYPACSHDGGDCASMKPEELAEGLAQMCAPGCNRADIGDGFCDAACQNDACEQDGGDCAQTITESPE